MKILLIPSSTSAEPAPWITLGRRLHGLGWRALMAADSSALGAIQAARLELVLVDSAAPLRARAEMLFAAAQDAALLLADAGAASLAASVAEACHLPLITVDFAPPLPKALLPRWRVLLPGLERWSTWLAQRPDLNAFRRDQGLPALPWLPPPHLAAHVLRLAAYSPRLATPPAGVTGTGFWLEETPPDWRASAELLAFLAAPNAPACVLLDDALTPATEALLKGIVRSHGRVLFVNLTNAPAPPELPPDVFWTDAAPLSWLLPRCTALLSSGAYSACATALKAGVPQWILANDGAAGIYGRLIAALGMGLPPADAAALNAEEIERGLRMLRADPGYRHKAAQLRHELRSEQGMDTALRWIQSIVMQQRTAAEPLRPE